MKHIKLLFYFISAVVFTSCMDTYTENYMANVPIYLSYDNLRSAVKSSPAKELEKPGKIYFKDKK